MSSPLHRVAAVQMSSSDLVSENITFCKQFIQEAKAQNASLVVLPENFAFMGENEGDKLSIAEEYGNGPIQKFLSDIATECDIWIVAGSIPLLHPATNKITSSCLVFTSQGQCIARYDKIHLFDVMVPNTGVSYQESSFFEAGNQIVTVQTPVAQIGLSICYDIRFPELYIAQLTQGSTVFCIPSAFTDKTGAAHWEILLRARAIENLSYVIASGQTGTHANGRKTYGHSMIISPWGEILKELNEGTGVIVAEIDLAVLEKIRTEFPSVKHRQPALYK